MMSSRSRSTPSRITETLLVLLSLTAPAYAQSPPPQPIPPGAATLGYTRLVIDEHPAVADISDKQSGHFKWFRNPFYTFNTPQQGEFKMTDDGVLQIGPRVSIVSTPRDFSKGALPVLSGAKGFYIEFEVRLSDNNPDHWPAVWAMPVEHNLKQEDHYRPDPPKFERWLELDVDEGRPHSTAPSGTPSAQATTPSRVRSRAGWMAKKPSPPPHPMCRPSPPGNTSTSSSATRKERAASPT
jgi:hypothetical protein